MFLHCITPSEGCLSRLRALRSTQGANITLNGVSPSVEVASIVRVNCIASTALGGEGLVAFLLGSVFAFGVAFAFGAGDSAAGVAVASGTLLEAMRARESKYQGAAASGEARTQQP